jgi:DNA-binding NtrC family response regulator
MEIKNKKIFIVDDDVFFLNMLKQILENEGYKYVEIFESEVQLLDQIHQEPSVVFVDYNLETFTGFEVLKKIKRYNPNIFVVMVSSQDKIQTAVNALKHGAFDYLEKNIKIEKDLIQCLQKIEEASEVLKVRKKSIFKTLFKL